MRHRILRAIESRGKLSGRPTADQGGQQMIEFTLTFIMLVVLLMALLLIGWTFFSYTSIASAAREGARHLMAHPTVPRDPVAFQTSNEETTWVVTNSIPMLDWRQATVNISPDLELRVPGGYVMVEIEYTVSLPRFEIPMIFRDETFVLGGPIEIQALSRRSLD